MACFLLRSRAGMNEITQNKSVQHTNWAPGHRDRCLGRDRELALLAACHELALQRRSAFVVVSGKSGMGKSTLLAEAQRRLRDRGALVLEGRCRPGLLSYRPLLEVARGAVEHLCEAGASEELLLVGEHLLDVLGGQATRSADSRLALFDQMAVLLQAVGDMRPVVVVLHDLDFADGGTLQLLRYLGRVLAASPELPRASFRGLIVASAADISAIPDDDGWSHSVNLVRIDLDGLDQDGIRAFLSSDEVVSRVMQATGGVPQLMERVVVDRLLGRNGLEVALADFDASEQRLLCVLSVFGRPLGPETLRLLSRLPHDGLARAIAGLSQRQVLEKMVVDGELRVGLAQVGHQQTIYRSMPDEDRRALHAEIGDYLQGREERELEACARHLLLGGCGERAIGVALEAGHRLELAFCFERAAELYERALQLASAEQEGRTADLTLVDRLCTVYEVTGQLDRALHHALRAQELRPDDPQSTLRIAHLHLVRGDFGAARVELEELEQSAVHLDEITAARMMADRAWALYLAGDNDAARDCAVVGLERCPASNEETTTVRISMQNTLGKIHLDQGRHDEARILFLANLEDARAWGLPAEEVRALVQLGQTSLQIGDHEHARQWYQEARTLADSIGEQRYLGACLQHLGVLAERRRDYAQALDLYQDAVAAWKKVGHRSYLAWVGLDLGKLYLHLGDLARAVAMADLAQRLADSQPPVAMQINLDLLRGGIAAGECRYGEALERFSRARTLAREAMQPEREARALIDLAALELDRGHSAEALRLLGELPEQLPSRLRCAALLLCGRAELEQDDLTGARTSLAEALELSDATADPEMAWQARYLLGIVALGQGRQAEARRCLREAAAGELQVRGGVPPELLEGFSEQPLRVALRRALGGQEQPKPRRPARDDRRCRIPEGSRGPAVDDRPAACAAIVGQHSRMRQIFDHVEKVAPTDALVLIRGESGTGKELIAEAIHRMSQRVRRPLVKVNCGALVESLLLSELFGHERGAFTGAMQRRKGRFEVADGGTIFLDEIGDISPKTQVALLRVLQNQEFERVGGTEPIQVDVRIICATNRDLEAMVRAGTFREDLYYRLRGVLIEVPPLRDRADDVLLLAEHFLARIAKERGTSGRNLSLAADKLLCCYRWPGNVRELENVLRSVTLFTDTEVIDVRDFSDYPELRQLLPSPAEDVAPESATALPAGPLSSPYEQIRATGISLKGLKKEIEARCITEALGDAGGNITRAAELLGMKRPRLSQLIKEHGISVADCSPAGWAAGTEQTGVTHD